MRDANLAHQDQSKLDISEKRLPQTRIKIKVKSTLDPRARLSRFTLPTLFGEKVVLRLLDKRTSA